MAVLELTDPRWRSFVAGHPDSTPFHHPSWAQLVADCYGFRAFALAIGDAAGGLRAGLPVVEVRHLRRRPRWVSLPFTDYCLPLARTAQDETQLGAVLQAEGAARGVRHFEVRGPLAGAPASSHAAVRHVLTLDADPASVFAGFHRSQVQRSIRRAERAGLAVRQAARLGDLTDTFYRLHQLTRRRQGVPVQPRRFFRLLWERAIDSGLGSVLVVEAAGEPIAAGVFLAWNQTVIYKFGASDAATWPLRPNHLLFWHAIRSACEQGYRWFDFGRTDADQDGLRRFKRSWGAAEEPVVYRALGGDEERTAAMPSGVVARMLAAAIRSGPPLVCRAVGETLYRYTALTALPRPDLGQLSAHPFGRGFCRGLRGGRRR